MANPLLAVLGLGAQNNQQLVQQQNQNGWIFANLGTAVSLYKMVRGSANPEQALQELVKTNHNAANTLAYIQQNGGDMNKIANDLAQKNGFPLQTITSLFK